MPRPKLYKTKEAKRLAICQKSQRYYYRNGESIRAKKRQKRLEASTKDGREERHRLPIHESAETQQTWDDVDVTCALINGQNAAFGNRPATVVVFDVQSQYRQLMNPKPALFFERLFQDLRI
ncbi:hypothetical protein V5O48_013515 [Marasmius crinis-equi]|uniref:Uncharacterized protein n=1 Tax=Marasmius crinis-equi TaxID=585013 RepID=A0ABR3EZV1_9AGAR